MKRVKFTVVFHLEEEVPDDWDEDTAAFHFEENHCLDNHVEALHQRIEADPTHCQTCNIGTIVLGHFPFDAIHALAMKEP